MNRGVEQRDIFLDDADRRRFLKLLTEVTSTFRWIVRAFVLMTNHYHALVETPLPTLSRGMQMLDGDYASMFNVRRQRKGHLFQGRFKGHLVEQDGYLLEVARYIVLNPVRAHMVEEPGQWPWSSYHATAGLEPWPAMLDPLSILDALHRDRPAACLRYRDFVAAGIGIARSPWEDLVANVYLGSESFRATVEQLTGLRTRRAEDSVRQRSVVAMSSMQIGQCVEDIFKVSLTPKQWRNDQARMAFAILARSEALAPLSEIARQLAITTSGAHALRKRGLRQEKSSSGFRQACEEVRVAISLRKKKV